MSNDNPYRESQFKTLKYCLTFPGTFASLEQAREFCAEFFYAYNRHHRHAGLGLLTPRSSTAAKPRPSTPGATWSWTRHIPCTAADPSTTAATQAFRQRLDQQASRERGRHAVIAEINCLEEVRFRNGTSTSSAD